MSTHAPVACALAKLPALSNLVYVAGHFVEWPAIRISLDSAGDFASAQATGACVDILGRTLHDRLDTTDIRLPGTVGTAMRVGNLDTKGNTLAAAFTLSHGTCTSYSEVWNSK